MVEQHFVGGKWTINNPINLLCEERVFEFPPAVVVGLGVADDGVALTMVIEVRILRLRGKRDGEQGDEKGIAEMCADVFHRMSFLLVICKVPWVRTLIFQVLSVGWNHIRGFLCGQIH